jgi:N utilization substance protein B
MEKKTNRRELREKVLQVLYAFEMNGEGLENIINGILADVDDKVNRDFCRNLIDLSIANRKELDKKIRECVNNWEMSRIALIDKLLLRMGLAEIYYFPDIPPKVSINEVIEISKNYSTSNSGKFINGILDTVLMQLKKAGKLNKIGRGLVDQSLKKSSGNDE